MRIRRAHILVVLLVLAVAAFFLKSHISRLIPHVMDALMQRPTVSDRLEQYAPAAEARLAPDFQRTGVPYPPERVVLVGLKSERSLEVYAAPADGPFRRIRAYPVLGASGGLGPKLREGDLQVPEGIYRVESLNPNSRFHLSLRLDYPNAFDRRQATSEGRDNLGGDIMVHGGTSSVGCLAIGDEAIEELFVLAARTGPENVSVILSPADLRRRPRPDVTGPPWLNDLYTEIEAALRPLP